MLFTFESWASEAGSSKTRHKGTYNGIALIELRQVGEQQEWRAGFSVIGKG